MIKRIPLGLLALLLLLLAAAVAAGTLAARARQVTVAPLPVLAVDREAAGAALSAVVRAREARPIALAPHQDVVPVMPGPADAVVNFSMLLGDTVQGVVRHDNDAVVGAHSIRTVQPACTHEAVVLKAWCQACPQTRHRNGSREAPAHR